MEMLYNSDNFAVVRIEVKGDAGASGLGRSTGAGLGRGGYEIVDKFARKEIFLQGAMADSFKQGVDALIESGPTAEEIDAYIERFASFMHPLMMH